MPDTKPASGEVVLLTGLSGCSGQQTLRLLISHDQQVVEISCSTPHCGVIKPSTDDNASRLSIYHERQSKQLCALHSLNNLFQHPRAFSKHDLDTICKELAPDARIFNPHRSALGLGSYDVNVIIAALGRKGFDVTWYDKRKDPSCLIFDSIFGFILNVPNTPSYTFLATTLNYIPTNIWSSQKHWVAIRKIGQYYYNLDSKLVSPTCIGDESAMLHYLRLNGLLEDVEILIVVPKGIEVIQDH